MKNQEQKQTSQTNQTSKQTNRDENDSMRQDVGHEGAAKPNNDSYDEIADQADENRTKKPGSQSNSGNQHNNGRGGGK